MANNFELGHCILHIQDLRIAPPFNVELLIRKSRADGLRHGPLSYVATQSFYQIMEDMQFYVSGTEFS